MAAMKKESKTSSKKHECNFCCAPCDGSIGFKRTKAYMGQKTGVCEEFNYCSTNCYYTDYRQKETPYIIQTIDSINDAFEENKHKYRKAISIISDINKGIVCDGEYIDEYGKKHRLSSRALVKAENFVVEWNSLVFNRKYYKLLLERAPYEVVELTRLKLLKYLGEYLEIELTKDVTDNEIISCLSNKIKHYEEDNIYMSVFCSK